MTGKSLHEKSVKLAIEPNVERNEQKSNQNRSAKIADKTTPNEDNIKGTHVDSLVPIDRGWAWVIMGLTFTNQLIHEGLFRSYGIFFNHFGDEFGSTKTEAVIPLCLAGAITFGFGPFYTALCDMLTCRYVLFIAAVTACLGHMICYFAESIWPIILGYGILYGIARGCVTAVGAIVINRYFSRKRSLALAIGMSGTSVGAMVLPPFVEELFQTYGLQGAYLILGGITLHFAVTGILCRPIIIYLEREKERLFQLKLQDYKSFRKEKLTVSLCKTTHENGPESDLHFLGTEAGDIESVRSISVTQTSASDTQELNTRSIYNEALMRRKSATSIAVSGSIMCLTQKNKSDKVDIARESAPWCQTFDDLQNLLAEDKDQDGRPILENVDQLLSLEAPFEDHPKHVIPEMRKSMLFWRTLLFKAFHIRNAETGEYQSLFDFKQLKRPQVLLYLIANSIGIGCLNMSTILIPGRAKNLNFSSKQVPQLLMIGAATDLCGRLLSGLLGTYVGPFKVQRYRIMFFYQAVFGVSGIVGGLILNDDNFALFAIYTGVVMIFHGAYVASVAVAFLDIVGMERFSRCFGFVLFFQAFSATASPLILGYIADKTASFQASLFYFGATSLASSVLFFLSAFIPVNLLDCMKKSS